MSSGWKAGVVVADGAAVGCGRAVSATRASSAALASGTLEAAIRIALSTAIENEPRAEESDLECRRFTPTALAAWQQRLEFRRMGIVRILMRAEKLQRVITTGSTWPHDVHALQTVPAAPAGAPTAG